MENEYLDALVMALFANLALLFVAGIFMLSSNIMHRGTLFTEKHGRVTFRRGAKRVRKDDKRNFVIAAAVASYLQAEQERKI